MGRVTLPEQVSQGIDRVLLHLDLCPAADHGSLLFKPNLRPESIRIPAGDQVLDLLIADFRAGWDEAAASDEERAEHRRVVKRRVRATILVLVAIVAIAILAILGPQIGNVFSQITWTLDNPPT